MPSRVATYNRSVSRPGNHFAIEATLILRTEGSSLHVPTSGSAEHQSAEYPLFQPKYHRIAPPMGAGKWTCTRLEWWKPRTTLVGPAGCPLQDPTVVPGFILPAQKFSVFVGGSALFSPLLPVGSTLITLNLTVTMALHPAVAKPAPSFPVRKYPSPMPSAPSSRVLVINRFSRCAQPAPPFPLPWVK